MYKEEILEQKGKLEKLCTANGYRLETREGQYPITFTLTKESSPQTSILTTEDGEVIEPAVIIISFASAPCVLTKGNATINADDLRKIISASKELQHLILQQFFYTHTTQTE